MTEDRPARRLRALFVRPAAAPRAPIGHDGDLRAAVLARSGDAVAVGAALGLALLGARGGRCAVVVALAGAGQAGRARWPVATSAARRVASALARRELSARAGGRIVHVELTAADAAARATERVAGVAEGPVVLAVGVPRTAAVDALLETCDLVVVATADADGVIGDLAARSLPAAVSAVAHCVIAPQGAAALLAQSGMLLAPSLDTALRPAIEALR